MRVRLVAVHGDEETIARAAWVSYGRSGRTATPDGVRRIVRYLVEHHHTTPLEHVRFGFAFTLPIFVARQLMRHRMASWNERSLRYVRGVVPHRWVRRWVLHAPPPPGASKQGRGAPLTGVRAFVASVVLRLGVRLAEWSYRLLLRLGVAPEQARAALPLVTTTEIVVSIDLHNLLHMLRLRMADDSQAETRAVATAVAGFVARHVPTVWEAARLGSVDLPPDGVFLWDDERGGWCRDE